LISGIYQRVLMAYQVLVDLRMVLTQKRRPSGRDKLSPSRENIFPNKD
jgi:hypothetical protein